jgi:hypothetical protein
MKVLLYQKTHRFYLIIPALSIPPHTPTNLALPQFFPLILAMYLNYFQFWIFVAGEEIYLDFNQRGKNLDKNREISARLLTGITYSPGRRGLLGSKD